MSNDERITSYGQCAITRNELIQMLKNTYEPYGKNEWHPKIGYVNTMTIVDENDNEREVQTITLSKVLK